MIALHGNFKVVTFAGFFSEHCAIVVNTKRTSKKLPSVSLARFSNHFLIKCHSRLENYWQHGYYRM